MPQIFLYVDLSDICREQAEAYMCNMIQCLRRIIFP